MSKPTNPPHRPPLDPDSPTVHVNIRVPLWMKEYFKEMGKGNVSAGVRCVAENYLYAMSLINIRNALLLDSVRHED